jgi:hypothetical protein
LVDFDLSALDFFFICFAVHKAVSITSRSSGCRSQVRLYRAKCMNVLEGDSHARAAEHQHHSTTMD